ncbi:hypothetical protein P170DRAFT_435583 [Aspergillus steynii IBT 23096]|uniref:Alpha N-terminal protein methyltransferase 1 n=1 Tax=Aspergillus steynii IBT 23096 TaxID=1392250 RepID=A0A2I2GBY4_9EURO|nr:uncharacterized protein P170DRAFT_435583 [Aspergillus steynii IBT 23096]PLB50392.1 hypothetical protein P170DRAFT_435583 [Aspergillus steynii IBT 23096]
MSSRSSTPGFPTGHDSSDSSPPPDSNIDHAHSLAYWNDIPATVDGMLGGFPQVSRIDLQGSKAFFAKTKRLLSTDPSLTSSSSTSQQPKLDEKLPRGVDCGAGIGRVTEGFLREVCTTVDAVEPVAKFSSVLRANREKAGPDAVPGDVYTLGLEDWVPERQYDLVWVQWCAGHLTDQQFVAFLRRCCACLTRGGFVVVKENTTGEGVEGDDFDEEDSSVTRTEGKFLSLFAEAGMRVFATELQVGFPRRLGLLPVRFFALRPVE